MVQNLDIFVFSQDLQLDKFKSAGLKHDNNFLKFYPKNSQWQHFWSKIHKSGIVAAKFRHFCFFTKFCNYTQGAEFKYYNILVKVLPKNTQIRDFWCEGSALLFLGKILEIVFFQGVDFKSDNSFFLILAQKYPIKAFLEKDTHVRHFLS